MLVSPSLSASHVTANCTAIRGGVRGVRGVRGVHEMRGVRGAVAVQATCGWVGEGHASWLCDIASGG